MAKHPACRYPDRSSRDLPIPPRQEQPGKTGIRTRRQTGYRRTDGTQAFRPETRLPVTTGKRSPKRALSRRGNVETQTESETSFLQEQTAGTGKHNRNGPTPRPQKNGNNRHQKNRKRFI